MIDFLEELEKFKPALEMEQLENTINGNEVLDLMDVLQQMTKQIKSSSKE